MKTVIIVHGMPSKEEYFDPSIPSESNNHWLPWLQKKLALERILSQAPEMPEPYTPDYTAWCAVFEQFTLGPDTILIGHSCGGGFLVRWLSEHREIQVGKVILVAPWIDPDHQDTDKLGDFFDFEIDPGLVNRTAGLTVMYSTDDEAPMLLTAEILKQHLPGAVFEQFTDKGHFTVVDMHTEAFPELLEHIIEK